MIILFKNVGIALAVNIGSAVWHLTFFVLLYLWVFVFLFWEDRKVLGWREGSRISKGPRGGNRTRAAVSAVALYVDALTMKLSAPTDFFFCLHFLQFISSCILWDSNQWRWFAMLYCFSYRNTLCQTTAELYDLWFQEQKIYIYAFGVNFYQFMHSLGIEPMTLVLLALCSFTVWATGILCAKLLQSCTTCYLNNIRLASMQLA